MDLKQETEEKQIAQIEQLVQEKVPGALCKKTPNQLLFTLPLSSTLRFPGKLQCKYPVIERVIN